MRKGGGAGALALMLVSATLTVLLLGLVLQPREELGGFALVGDLEVEQLVKHRAQEGLKLVRVAAQQQLEPVHRLVEDVVHAGHLGDVRELVEALLHVART